MVFSIRRWASSAQGEIHIEEEAKLLGIVGGILARCYPIETPETARKNGTKKLTCRSAGMWVMPETPKRNTLITAGVL
jgi:hypothetical protein